MIGRAIVAASILLAQPVCAAEVVFDCTVDPPQATNAQDGSYVTKPISIHGAGSGGRSFTMSANARKVTVSWPDSPIGVSGSSNLLMLGDDSYAAFFSAKRACIFNDAICGASLIYSVQPDNSAILQFTPLATQSFADGHTEPFVAFLKGRCTLRKEVK